MSPDRASQRLLDAVLRRSFPAFLEKTFSTLNPGVAFISEWYLDAIASKLEQVRTGKITRLIINLPPRSLKSIMVSVAFPAFLLGGDPTRRIIGVSYSPDLARKHSNDFRAVIETDWYQRVFPGARIGNYKNTEGEVELMARGFRLAASVGGTLTGRGGDVIIIDDPLKPDDAHSEAKRSAANHWFSNTLLSRLDNKRTGAIIIVMQRVHLDDLSGFLRRTSDEWDVLTLPAIATTDEIIELGPNHTYLRKAGDALSPAREPLHVLEALRNQIGSDAFSAQYQQMPAPPGGAMIKRVWLGRYDKAPTRSEFRLIIQSWDTASKGGPDNDWSVCTTWGLTRDRRWYLLDVWRRRVDYPTLKFTAISLAAQYRPHRILIEDSGAGTSLVQELKRERLAVFAIRPESDKVSRMAVASAKFEAGHVCFPQNAPWLAELEAELFSFPGARHDDQVDSISQAINDNNVRMPLIISDEMLRWSEQKTRYREGRW